MEQKSVRRKKRENKVEELEEKKSRERLEEENKSEEVIQ